MRNSAELDRVVNQNVGKDELAQMLKEEHPLVTRDKEGRPAMLNATNTQLRKQNYDLQIKVETLTNQMFSMAKLIDENRESLQDLRDLLRATRKDLRDIAQQVTGDDVDEIEAKLTPAKEDVQDPDKGKEEKEIGSSPSWET